MSSWTTAEAELNKWEQDRRDMAKLENQDLSELNKKTILKRLLGTVGNELNRELERDKSLRPFDHTAPGQPFACPPSCIDAGSTLQSASVELGAMAPVEAPDGM